MNSATAGVGAAQAALRPINWPRVARRVVLYLVVSILAVLFLVPVYGVLVTAFKTIEDVSTGGYWDLPPPPPPN